MALLIVGDIISKLFNEEDNDDIGPEEGCKIVIGTDAILGGPESVQCASTFTKWETDIKGESNDIYALLISAEKGLYISLGK